jgi:hypothetical protein
LLRSNKKAGVKADKNEFFIDKPAVSAAGPWLNRLSLYIAVGVAKILTG